MEVLSNCADVLTLIRIGREFQIRAEGLQVPQPQSDGEYLDLSSGVVFVVVFLHIVTGGSEQVGK